jgi:DNA-binding transcriptional LysR family regulator
VNGLCYRYFFNTSSWAAMSFLTLDLNLLRVFDAVMTEQNLTRAAGHLAMTQPAVSNAIKRLRESLGDELLIRTAYGVKPTPRAEALWPSVRSAGQPGSGRGAGNLRRLGRPRHLPHGDGRRHRRHVAAVADALDRERSAGRQRAHGAADHARTAPDAAARRHRPGRGFLPGVAAQLSYETGSPIRHERLYSGKYVCVMRRDHPLSKVELTLDNYCAANHLLVSFSGRAHGLVDEALAQLQRERRILLTVNQFFTAGRVVANSDLITVLPRHLIAATGMTDALIHKELPFQLPAVHLDMLWHERDARSPAHKWLRMHLEK